MAKTKTEMRPIDWSTVAVVAFDGDRAVIIASAEPLHLWDAMDNLVAETADDVDDAFMFDGDRDRPEEVREAVSKLRWELHPVEQAKELLFGCLSRSPEP